MDYSKDSGQKFEESPEEMQRIQDDGTPPRKKGTGIEYGRKKGDKSERPRKKKKAEQEGSTRVSWWGGNLQQRRIE